jgi:NADH-quinone oxidoreductase subunit M
MWAVFAASGIVLGAAYMLYLYQRTMFGKIENPKNEKLLDLSGREFATFAPLIVLAVWIGLYPKPILDRLDTSVHRVIARVSPQYSQLAADCGATSPAVVAGGLAAAAPSPELLATNSAARFLAAAPCGADGKPLDQNQTGAPR